MVSIELLGDALPALALPSGSSRGDLRQGEEEAGCVGGSTLDPGGAAGEILGAFLRLDPINREILLARGWRKLSLAETAEEIRGIFGRRISIQAVYLRIRGMVEKRDPLALALEAQLLPRGARAPDPDPVQLEIELGIEDDPPRGSASEERDPGEGSPDPLPFPCFDSRSEPEIPAERETKR